MAHKPTNFPPYDEILFGKIRVGIKIKQIKQNPI